MKNGQLAIFFLAPFFVSDFPSDFISGTPEVFVSKAGCPLTFFHVAHIFLSRTSFE
jgi:hypothetical protein